MKVKVSISIETDLDAPTHEALYEAYGSISGLVDAAWTGEERVTVEVEAA